MTDPNLPQANRGETAFSFLFDFFAKVRKILFNPSSFFTQDLGSLPSALAFGLVCSWIGAGLEYLLSQSLSNSNPMEFFSRYRDQLGLDPETMHSIQPMLESAQDRLYHWYMGLGPVIADPFFTLVKLGISALFVFLAGRILITPGRPGTPRAVEFDTIIKILAYSMTPMLLSFIPILSSPIIGIYSFYLTAVAIREIYQVSFWHAVLVILFPKLIALGLAFLVFFSLVALFLGLLVPFFAASF